MRIVLYGVCDLTLRTADKFIDENHDVIIIDPDKEKVEEVSESLDCSFLVGNASYPAVLKEINPKETDLLFALSDDSQTNMVTCLVARTLGVKKTVLRVDDPDYEKVCHELEISDVIVPTQITSQYLFDIVFNENLLELFKFMKEKAFLYKIIATEKEAGKPADLNLSTNTRIVCYFRDGKFHHFDESVDFEIEDEIVLLTGRENLRELLDRWGEG